MNSSTAQFESNRTFSSSSFDYGRLALMLGDFSVALTASVANSLLLVIIYKDPHRNLRSPSTNLVINMAVADFLTGFLSGFLVTAYDGLLFMGRTARSLERYLLVNIVVAVVSIMVGCCNVVAMACDRWLAVTAALNYRTIVTVRRVNSFIVLFWIYAIGFVGLSFYRAIPKNVYELLYCHLHVSLPLIVLPLLYWKTFRALEAHSRRMTNLGPGNQRMNAKTVCAERKTTKAFVIVLCLFYVSFLPYVVVVNLKNFCPVCAVSKGFQVFLHIAYRFLILNCCLDPFVYAWRIPKYRRAVRTVFNRCYRFRRRNAIDPDVTGISMYGTPGLQTTNAAETYQT